MPAIRAFLFLDPSYCRLYVLKIHWIVMLFCERQQPDRAFQNNFCFPFFLLEGVRGHVKVQKQAALKSHLY